MANPGGKPDSCMVVIAVGIGLFSVAALVLGSVINHLFY